MTARSIRRAIERKAQKQARKKAIRLQANPPCLSSEFEAPEDLAGNTEDFETPALHIEAIEETTAPKFPSPARLAANRRNAQLSTGPQSAAGKAKASLNAVKTGLTGRTVLLPGEDAAVYQRHLRRFFDTFKPAADRETELVQRLADTQWRLHRIPEIEAGIYALARIQFAEMFAAYQPEEAACLIQAQTYLTHHKQLNNLSIQEARLHRQYAKDMKELRELRDLRRKRESIIAQHTPAVSTPPAPRLGFDFSNTLTHSATVPASPESQGKELSQAA